MAATSKKADAIFVLEELAKTLLDMLKRHGHELA